ncbi:MAG: diguanylate cyclase [Planctomycetota bacterium]|nr:diguanylate cyclase [Planctomycetota bacterium]
MKPAAGTQSAAPSCPAIQAGSGQARTHIPSPLPRTRTRFLFIVAIVAQVLALGLLDYYTHARCEVSFSIFYLLPILQAAWFLGRVQGTGISALCAATWFVSDRISEQAGSDRLIPLWNTIMLFGFFLLVTLLVGKVVGLLEEERRLARTDSLTGVANGRHFNESAQIEIQRANRHMHSLSTAYIDLDDFKRVNDTLGHSVGDVLLRAVAGTIKENIRASDLVARLGGDEFGILMPETDQEGAKSAVTKVRDRVMDLVRDRKWPVTLSIGVATCLSPQCSVDGLIKMADDLMYSVKSNGKNGVRFEMTA